MENFPIIIDKIDKVEQSTSQYNFAEHGHCQKNRKGQIRLHRRLLWEVFGTNIPSRMEIKISELKNEDEQHRNFILEMLHESYPERISIYKHRHGCIITLNTFFYLSGLNYKRYQFSFTSEPVKLSNNEKAIQLTINEVKPWPDSPFLEEDLSDTNNDLSNYKDHIVTKSNNQFPETAGDLKNISYSSYRNI